MFDLRPVGYVIGLLVAALGASMSVPMLFDFLAGNDHWQVFLEAGAVTGLTGGLTAVACANAERERLSIQQTFLLTTGVWLTLPVFAALPFVFGATEARYVDAFFEAMSGLTTTGSTVFSGLENLPPGLLLWRGLMQWFGGIGIIVVAMVFLPELRIGGMQIFRSEGFDTFGKILPRATEIASRISVIYLSLTGTCALVYLILGMTPFDATVHAMTTVATGGFANTDASFSDYSGAIEYAAVVFMLMAALPFVRFVQLVGGSAKPMLMDPQIRAFFGTVAVVVALVALWKMFAIDTPSEPAFRKSLFNSVSILTGTGYASDDYMLWGAFPVVVLFFAGLIGGCAGSTSCSIKVFRYQLLIASILSQIRRIRSPHGLFSPRFGGRPVSEDVLSSVMAFFVMFTVSLGILSILLAMTGLDFITSVSGAATALGNIGPGLGDQIGPAGNFAEVNDTAKWILAAAMLIGRLELMVVFAIFTRRFWQA
ncbi:TrkH family potassium uptake protein [Tropicimonas sp. S265A]|uniref:TrkH family potassium uptake protein n=1 Tax=Tropicimonas sp. S265A TaxID=3415134 RepID=UPI003C7D7D5F